MSLKTKPQLKPAPFEQKEKWSGLPSKIITAPLFWILVISAIIRLVYYSVLLNTTAVDTASYINFNANILVGETDGRRTPVYPYFIKLVSLFGRQNLVDHVITAQIVLSFLSIILFYYVARVLFKNNTIIFCASLLYGVMLPVINFDKLVLTESLSVSFSLVFIYAIVSYLQKPANSKAWLLSLFVFMAIMLRPSFIYLLPLILVFWILRLLVFKKDRKMCLSGLAASVLVILLLQGYSALNKKNAGFYGISLISNSNELAVVTNANIYLYGNDPELSAAIKINQDLAQRNNTMGVRGVNIMQTFNPERIHTFIVACIKNQPVAYAQHIGGKLLDLGSTNIFTNYAEHKSKQLAFRIENIEYLVFFVSFNILYFFIVLDLLMLIIRWVKRKQVPWLNLFLWLMITGQMVVALAASYSEYQRLIVAAVPALIILLFFHIDRISYAIDSDKLKSYPVTV